MMMKQSIAVLLTVHNRKANTLECLQRLYTQLPLDGYQVDVYLTDDGCTDGTPDAVSQQFPQVHIIHGDGNLFWNRGMYTAWQEAAKKNYEFYLWLNDDTFVYPNMFSTLLHDSQQKQNKAIIVGPTLSADHKTTTYGGRLANGQIATVNGELTSISHFNGNIVLIPRYVYQQLGNLDYYFTHSKGDFDYGLRAAKAKIAMYQVGVHLGECELHETLNTWCNPKKKIKQRWKMLHSPTGLMPKEIYYLEKRHYGIYTAVFHYCSIYLRCIFPKLWLR